MRRQSASGTAPGVGSSGGQRITHFSLLKIQNKCAEDSLVSCPKRKGFHFLVIHESVATDALMPLPSYPAPVSLFLSLSLDSECGLELVLPASLVPACHSQETCLPEGEGATEERRCVCVCKRERERLGRDESLLSGCYFHDVRGEESILPGNQFKRREKSARIPSAPLAAA